MRQKVKHIEPRNGLGQLLFGLVKDEVVKIIGEPDRKFKEKLNDHLDIELWEYDDLGLSLRFDGSKLMKLSSMSIISSFYEYNGVSIIGKNINEVSKLLKDVEHKIVKDRKSPKQKLIFSKELSLIVWFEYDTATSLSWDTSDVNIEEEKEIRQVFKRFHDRKASTKKYVKVKSIKKRRAKKDRGVEKKKKRNRDIDFNLLVGFFITFIYSYEMKRFFIVPILIIGFLFFRLLTRYKKAKKLAKNNLLINSTEHKEKKVMHPLDLIDAFSLVLSLFCVFSFLISQITGPIGFAFKYVTVAAILGLGVYLYKKYYAAD